MHTALALWLTLGLAPWAAPLDPPATDPPATDPPVAVAPPVVLAPRMDAAPDPALVARNQRLTARSQRGDRFLIAGRLVGSAAGLVMGGGIAMLVVHYVTEREDRELLVAGAVLTAVGGAINGASGGLTLYGKREVEAARRGELQAARRAGPRRVQLVGVSGVRVRF